MSRYAPVELLTPNHDRSTFDCGSADQTLWFRRFALIAQQADTARVYVACRTGESRVVGYYALAAGSVQPEAASVRLGRGAGRHPIPVVILARLGVDLGEQGHGLGTALVRDALLQTASVATRIGVRALLIHAETPQAAAFYTRFDAAFEPSPSDPLVLLLKNIRAGIRKAAHGRRTSRPTGITRAARAARRRPLARWSGGLAQLDCPGDGRRGGCWDRASYPIGGRNDGGDRLGDRRPVAGPCAAGNARAS